MLVYLYSAPLFYVGSIAEHHWLVVDAEERIDRWEIWQHANAGGESWGHLHRNLRGPEQAVGRGPAFLRHTWDGDVASEIASRLARSPVNYPWRDSYRMWPGPNSNTYIQWILRRQFRLGWKGIGKSYAHLAADSSSQTG